MQDHPREIFLAQSKGRLRVSQCVRSFVRTCAPAAGRGHPPSPSASVPFRPSFREHSNREQSRCQFYARARSLAGGSQCKRTLKVGKREGRESERATEMESMGRGGTARKKGWKKRFSEGRNAIGLPVARASGRTVAAPARPLSAFQLYSENHVMSRHTTTYAARAAASRCRISSEIKSERILPSGAAPPSLLRPRPSSLPPCYPLRPFPASLPSSSSFFFFSSSSSSSPALISIGAIHL